MFVDEDASVFCLLGVLRRGWGGGSYRLSPGVEIESMKELGLM